MLTILALCAVACTDSLARSVAPKDTVNTAATIPAPLTVTGCATFQISLHGSNVAAITIPTASCGPVVPVIIGAAQFNANSGMLTLPIAIRNAGRLRIHAPVGASLRADSMAVPGVGGLSRISVSVALPAPGDSVGPSGAFARLSYASELPTHVTSLDTSVVLLSQVVSAPRTISVQVPLASSAIRVTVHAHGTYLFTVPVKAPRVTADSILREGRDSTHYAYIGKASYARDKLLVRFLRTATEEDRQAAIDAVDGIVIGGAGGDYYLRVPASPHDTKGSAVNRAMSMLRTQRGVRSVALDVIDVPDEFYLRPTDGTGFTSWPLAPGTGVH